MPWTVIFHEEFEPEFRAFPQEVQDALFVAARVLQAFGHRLGRPHVDTLKDSDFANMKELRFEAADGEWRAAFAFDPKQQAVILVAGDKSGMSSKLFYRRLLKKADKRFRAWKGRK